MIDHDYINSHRAGCRDQINIIAAAVHGDQQVNVVGGCSLDHIGAQPIAVGCGRATPR